MKPRLFSSVKAIAVRDGLLLRKRETYLPVAGQYAADCFERLQLHLDGSSSLREICRSLKPGEANVIVTLVKALRRAGMLYDATQDDTAGNINIPHDLPYLGRMAALGKTPNRSWAKAVSSRVLFIGREELVSSMIEMAASVGFKRLGWLPAGPASANSTSTAGWKSSLPDGHPLDVLPCAGMDDLKTAAREFDLVVIAGNELTDGPWLRAIDDHGLGIPVIPVLTGRDRTWVGPFPTPCLGMCLESYARQPEQSPDLCPDRSLAAAACLLIQAILDISISSREKMFQSIYELEPQTGLIRRRPMPSHLMCDAGPNAEVKPNAVPGIEPLRLRCERLYGGLVDDRTGVFQEAGEFNLDQLPYHQSAVLLCKGNGPQQSMVNEAGGDLFEARLAALRSALELHLASEPSLSRIIAQQTCGPAIDARQGIVASANSDDELLAESFYRSLARWAHVNEANWKMIGFPPDIHEAETNLIAGYLRDLDCLRRVSVERSLLFEACGIEVLRFVIDGRVVSIVAGPGQARHWTFGLTDVWLHLSGAQSFAGSGSLLAFPRFRFSGSSLAKALFLKEELKNTFGFNHHFMPLSFPVLGLAAPWRFAYGFITKHADKPRTNDMQAMDRFREEYNHD
jgi:hypothetical protein